MVDNKVEETKDIKEVIVVKDGAIDRVPVESRTTRTYKLGVSRKTGKRYRTTLNLSDMDTVIGKGAASYVFGDDVKKCVDLYNNHLSAQIDSHELIIKNLKSLIVEGNCNE